MIAQDKVVIRKQIITSIFCRTRLSESLISLFFQNKLPNQLAMSSHLMRQSTVNAAPNYPSGIIAYNKLVTGLHISYHNILTLSFYKAQSLLHTLKSKKRLITFNSPTLSRLTALANAQENSSWPHRKAGN
jgi:hypothetical protein